MDIKEQSLKLALEATACRELPKAYKDGAGFWIKAIVLVRKRNQTQSYALAERRADGVIRYVKDFGLMSQIEGLVSVHPYVYFDEERFMCPYKSVEAQRRSLLSFFGTEREQEIMEADSDKLKLLSREMGIKVQLENRPQDIVADAMKRSVEEAGNRQVETLLEGTEVMHTSEGPEEMKTISTARDFASSRGKSKTKR